MKNIAFILCTIIAFALPIVLMVIWRKKTGCAIKPFIVGALCFALFATLIEPIFHTLIMLPDNAVSRFITNSPIVYALYGGLAAGLFEETGRLFGFKVLLKDYKEIETSVGYGIGHGGIECILTLGITYLLYTIVILGGSLGDSVADAAVISTISSININIIPLAIIERVLAITLHIGLSILVFGAVNYKKYRYLFVVAILIHMIADIPAGLYQAGAITSLLIVELLTAVVSVSTIVLAIIFYKKMEEELDA